MKFSQFNQHPNDRLHRAVTQDTLLGADSAEVEVDFEEVVVEEAEAREQPDVSPSNTNTNTNINTNTRERLWISLMIHLFHL